MHQDALEEMRRFMGSAADVKAVMAADPGWLLRVERGPKRLGEHPDSDLNEQVRPASNGGGGSGTDGGGGGGGRSTIRWQQPLQGPGSASSDGGGGGAGPDGPSSSSSKETDGQ